MYRIEDAVAIIINEIDPDEKVFDKKVEFLQYFVDQWLNAKMSKQGPEIWNQHLATIRTNNASESNHSIQSSIIPRHHGLVSEIISYFKHSDSKSSDQFLKLQNNFASSQSRSSRTQKDFDFNLTITHEEFIRGLISFENYYDKICNLIVGRHVSYPASESESETDEVVPRSRKDKKFDTSKNPVNTFETIDFLGKFKKKKLLKPKNTKITQRSY